MAWKITRAIGVQARRTAIGRMKGRGGAGAVAAGLALALAFAVVGTAFTATACSPDVPAPDSLNPHEGSSPPDPWDVHEKASPAPETHGSGPSRLPC